MCNPLECGNAVRGDDDWGTGPCGENPGELLKEIERLRAIVDTFSAWLESHALDLRDDDEPGNTVQAAWDNARSAAEAGKRNPGPRAATEGRRWRPESDPCN